MYRPVLANSIEKDQVIILDNTIGNKCTATRPGVSLPNSSGLPSITGMLGGIWSSKAKREQQFLKLLKHKKNAMILKRELQFKCIFSNLSQYSIFAVQQIKSQQLLQATTQRVSEKVIKIQSCLFWNTVPQHKAEQISQNKQTGTRVITLPCMLAVHVPLAGNNL